MLTLHDALNSKTVDELKKLLPFVPEEQGASNKAGLVGRITNGLIGDQGENLKRQYAQLDKCQQLAVAEALYDPEGEFFPDEFYAKYQESPAFAVIPDNQESYSYRYSRLPTRLCLFLFGNQLCLPADLLPLLKEFVAKPPPVRLFSQAQLPEPDKREEGLQIRLCEQEVLTDLPTIINLIQQGKLKASAKTGRASAATLKVLAQSLNGGEFYDLERPKKYRWSQEIGGIKTVAWPLLLQSAKLAQVNGSKLELSRSGVKQLTKATPDTIRLIWKKWQKNTLLDEFSRIDEIKG